MNAEDFADDVGGHEDAMPAWGAPSRGPTVLAVVVAVVSWGIGAVCTLVAFVGAGVGVGDPHAYDGWAIAGLVLGLAGPLVALAVGIVRWRAERVASTLSAGIVFVVFGLLLARVDLGVLL